MSHSQRNSAIEGLSRNWRDTVLLRVSSESLVAEDLVAVEAELARLRPETASEHGPAIDDSDRT